MPPRNNVHVGMVLSYYYPVALLFSVAARPRIFGLPTKLISRSPKKANSLRIRVTGDSTNAPRTAWSRFGDKLLEFWVVCPQNETAVLKGIRFRPWHDVRLFHTTPSFLDKTSTQGPVGHPLEYPACRTGQSTYHGGNIPGNNYTQNLLCGHRGVSMTFEWRGFWPVLEGTIVNRTKYCQ